MYFERITDARHPLYDAAMELYKKSFPPHERRETPSQKTILGNPDYQFTLVFHREQFVGLVLSCPEPITSEVYAAFDGYLKREVMREAF